MSFRSYRGYVIEYDPGSLSAFWVNAPWVYCHEEYDGAPLETGGPPGDDRCGAQKTFADVLLEIDTWHEAEVLLLPARAGEKNS